ncbi:MAG: Ldh family oxidoreductase [Promethearchaeota archaeon]|jgi:uncharacterized oxidoreductase
MPTFSHEYLNDICTQLLKSEGVEDEIATKVAKNLIMSNLMGHDSHGLVRLSGYIKDIRKGFIVPNSPFEIVSETPNTACINGNWGFGFIVTEKAMKLAIQKAKANDVAALTVYNQSHIGRLGYYPPIAAQEGMIALITADSGGGSKKVVPFGGTEGRLGTNPLSIAIPSNLDCPIVLDMATSIVAGGKIQVATARKKKVPEGWVLDKNGNPSTDPSCVSEGGFILPLGGDKGYKGYGLSFIVEVLSSILTGLGFGLSPEDWKKRHGIEYRHNDGCFIAVFNVKAFYPLEKFKEEVTALAKFMKTSPPAKDLNTKLTDYFGFELDEPQVLYPGEPEWLIEKRRRKVGIFIEDNTWNKVKGLIQENNLENILGKE